VQRVTLSSTWLQRPFGLCSVRADSASSGTSVAEDQKGGWDLVVPLADRARAEAVLPVLLPGADARAVPWRRVSHLLAARIALEAAVLAALSIALMYWWLGPASLLVLLLVPVAWLLGQLIWHNFAWAVGPGFVALRRGILGRYQAFIPLAKVQSVILLAGPVDRLFGLAQLVVHVAGGSPTALHNLTRADAEGLRALVADAAVAAARREWQRAPVASVP
jgi:membrane protein YdbS with pleckstrin-like domain